MAYTNHMASLKAAAEDKTNPSVSKVTSFAVDPRVLEVREGFNARPLNQDHVEQMAISYANGATFPPLDVEVEDGHIYPVDGHHRRAAALLAISRGAPIRSVECRQFRGNDADKVAHLITSAGGLPLTPLQLGIQYRKLIGFGWTEKQIADRVGKTGVHVKDMITLAEANSDVHKMVNAGEVSGTTALEAVKKHGSQAGAVISEKLQQAKAEGKTKVTPSMLAKQSDEKSLSDKQLLAFLLNSARRAGPADVDGRDTWTITFTAPQPPEGSAADLRAAVIAAATAQA